MVVLDQKPESKRMTNWPMAPARRSRATSSSTKRLVPRWVLAEPLRMRTCRSSPVAGPGGEEGVVAELSGVAIAGAVFGLAAHLTDGRVEVDDHRFDPGPAPSAHARRRGLGQHRSRAGGRDRR